MTYNLKNLKQELKQKEKLLDDPQTPTDEIIALRKKIVLIEQTEASFRLGKESL